MIPAVVERRWSLDHAHDGANAEEGSSLRHTSSTPGIFLGIWKCSSLSASRSGFPHSMYHTNDTVFVVNGGRSRLWEATGPKLKKCLKAAQTQAIIPYV